MSNITDLQTKINTYNTEFAKYFKSPELLATLKKTFTSHNITIEDWNTVVETVKDNLELTPNIKEILNNVGACLEELYKNAPSIINKVTKTSTPNQVYGTDDEGNQYTYTLSNATAAQNQIPLRNSNGHLFAGSDMNFEDFEAVSSYYVMYHLNQKELELKDNIITLDDRLSKVETGKANASETNERFASAELRLDNLEDDKVSIVDNLDDNNPYVLYGAEFNDTATEQKTYPMSEDAIEGTIARRTTNGELAVGDPTLESSATNKKYVDNALSNKADLVNGKVPSSQLPSYVDDVMTFSALDNPAPVLDLTAYSTESDAISFANLQTYLNSLFKNPAIGSPNDLDKSEYIGIGFVLGTNPPFNYPYLVKCIRVTGGNYYLSYERLLENVIYLNVNNNLTYRYNGLYSHSTILKDVLTEISQSLALGETSSTAYAGDKGKANADAIASLQDNKLDKVTGTTTYTQVYAKSGNTGAQAMIGVSSHSVPHNLVRRGVDSLFDVSEPIRDANPTTKKYVDDTINSKMENLNIRNGVGPYSLR